MTNYPKVQKTLSKLSKHESIRDTTIQLVAGALLSTGILLAASTPVEAKSVTAADLSSLPSQGSAILLGPSPTLTGQGNVILAQGHYSHSSHASHASHHSHYSSR